MKDYKSLAGAVIRIAIMIGVWVWALNLPQDAASIGRLVLVIPGIILYYVLIYGTIKCIVKFIESLKKVTRRD